MGEVWMLVRGSKCFGDSKLILYGRVSGTEAWGVLDEMTVDPEWNVIAWPELLDVPGRFDIRVTTSKGSVVAKGTVSIIDK